MKKKMNDVEKFLVDQQRFCNQLYTKYINKNSILQCPPSFDGLLCWPQTNSNETISLSCPPKYVLGYNNPNPNPIATKHCNSNGEWYTNVDGRWWTNYTLCIPPSGQYITVIKNVEIPVTGYGINSSAILLNKWLPIIKTVAKIGYTSSFLMLIIAMIIFSLIRRLRNPRNRLHMNLFVSFIMRAFMVLLKDWLFIDGLGLAWDVVVDGDSTFIKERNFWVCKAITSIWQYFIVANYTWIFIEGLYLHNLVFFAFCAETSTITIYIVFGWGIPAIIVGLWIAVRIFMEDTLCWTTHNDSSLFLIIRIPIMASILLNFILFINIVRVLLVKMKMSVYLQRKKMQYGRWAKSTLVLVPLFGAHYTLFLGLSYHKDHQIELIWLFCDQLFASFQGSFVALLYCILNTEVRAEVKRAWKAQQSRRDVEAWSATHRHIAKTFKSRSRIRSINNNPLTYTSTL